MSTPPVGPPTFSLEPARPFVPDYRSSTPSIGRDGSQSPAPSTDAAPGASSITVGGNGNRGPNDAAAPVPFGPPRVSVFDFPVSPGGPRDGAPSPSSPVPAVPRQPEATLATPLGDSPSFSFPPLPTCWASGPHSFGSDPVNARASGRTLTSQQHPPQLASPGETATVGLATAAVTATTSRSLLSSPVWVPAALTEARPSCDVGIAPEPATPASLMGPPLPLTPPSLVAVPPSLSAPVGLGDTFFQFSFQPPRPPHTQIPSPMYVHRPHAPALTGPGAKQWELLVAARTVLTPAQRMLQQPATPLAFTARCDESRYQFQNVPSGSPRAPPVEPPAPRPNNPLVPPSSCSVATPPSPPVVPPSVADSGAGPLSLPPDAALQAATGSATPPLISKVMRLRLFRRSAAQAAGVRCSSSPLTAPPRTAAAESARSARGGTAPETDSGSGGNTTGGSGSGHAAGTASPGSRSDSTSLTQPSPLRSGAASTALPPASASAMGRRGNATTTHDADRDTPLPSSTHTLMLPGAAAPHGPTAAAMAWLDTSRGRQQTQGTDLWGFSGAAWTGGGSAFSAPVSPSFSRHTRGAGPQSPSGVCIPDTPVPLPAPGLQESSSVLMPALALPASVMWGGHGPSSPVAEVPGTASPPPTLPVEAIGCTAAGEATDEATGPPAVGVFPRSVLPEWLQIGGASACPPAPGAAETRTYAATVVLPAVPAGTAVEFAADYAACLVAFYTPAAVADGFVEAPDAKMEDDDAVVGPVMPFTPLKPDEVSAHPGDVPHSAVRWPAQPASSTSEPATHDPLPLPQPQAAARAATLFLSPSLRRAGSSGLAASPLSPDAPQQPAALATRDPSNALEAATAVRAREVMLGVLSLQSEPPVPGVPLCGSVNPADACLCCGGSDSALTCATALSGSIATPGVPVACADALRGGGEAAALFPRRYSTDTATMTLSSCAIASLQGYSMPLTADSDADGFSPPMSTAWSVEDPTGLAPAAGPSTPTACAAGLVQLATEKQSLHTTNKC